MEDNKEALLKLEAHERECAQRMKNIQFQLDTVDKRLDQGMHKFRNIERLLWLLFPVILGADAIAQNLLQFKFFIVYLVHCSKPTRWVTKHI